MKTLQMLVSSVSLAFNAQTKNERTVLQIFFFWISHSMEMSGSKQLSSSEELYHCIKLNMGVFYL